QDVHVPLLHREDAELVLHELVVATEEVPRVAEGHKVLAATGGLVQRSGELKRLDHLRIVQVRRGAIFRDQLDTVRGGPQRQEFRQLGVEADARDLTVFDAGQGFVQLRDAFPVADVDVVNRQACYFERGGVGDHQDDV